MQMKYTKNNISGNVEILIKYTNNTSSDTQELFVAYFMCILTVFQHFPEMVFFM